MKRLMRLFVLVVGIVALIGLYIFLGKVFSGQILLKRYIFKLGWFELRWYSLLIVSGILLGYALVRRRLERYKINPDHVDEAIFWGIIAAIIGARTYYVIFMWGDFYSKYPGEIFKIWHGGLAIHGAIIGAILSTFLYTRLKKNCTFTFLQGLDLFTSVLPLGQAIGRWGNFFNYEAFGSPTDLPWGMYIPPANRPLGLENFSKFHPTFLYESVGNFIIFLVLYNYDLRKKSNGETTALYFILYSANRFWIEGLRTDSLYLGNMRIAQLVSIVLIVLGLIMFLYLRKNKKAAIDK
ncbi:prolipoprotein diacylglyceryl transferase [Thermosipho ferrireducens]|uniref:Phosphatidylglycerol--prolipoprotein diacylglyceryl transferase n=1 Tax=Thermosipho ferrireducens TaxID=2571116 RepID=A0ABX7S8H7_9BACT|nr:prolipoprotein diacylglyceryl transferase [Thermosipho ferrireducens]QTA37410.1 prolipoprotein diacylglyceryl transferase [Thermosipho ferrireducens]